MSLIKVSVDKNLPGYLGGPQGRPAVIVLQEWWGVTNSVKQQAETVAERGGYRVLIPDLYKGKIGVNAEEGHHLMENLDWPNAVTELKKSVEFLRADGSSKVGAVGFCMGGALSLLAAEHANVQAAVSFYGKPDPRMGSPEKISVPIQAHSGSNDAFKGFADPATVKPWVENIPEGKGAFFEYPGEGHGFMNAEPEILKTMKEAGMPIGKKESQDKAWERVLDFFKIHLG